MGKVFKKQIKAIEDQSEKQVKALNTFKPDNEKLIIDDVFPGNALKMMKHWKSLIKLKK